MSDSERDRLATDTNLEVGYERVALFTDDEALEGPSYGRIVRWLRRPRP